jgi:antitoxin ParD1/3/4
MTALDASIAQGLADVEAGRTARATAVFDRLEGKYRAKQRNKVDSGSSPE